MFSEFFKALKRITDSTIAPMLIALVMTFFEWKVRSATWMVITIADFALGLVEYLFSLIPIPEGLALTAETFGEQFLDFAEVAGLWPALQLYISGLGIYFIYRIALSMFGFK